MKAPIPLWAAASAAHLLLLLLFIFFFSVSSAADRDRCPWLFDSCGRLAGAECRFFLRRQCNCSALIKSLSKAAGVVLRPSDAVLRTECIDLDGEQRLNVSVSQAKAILETMQRRPGLIAALCDIPTCTPLPAWCPWTPWEPSSLHCRYLLKTRRQERCCDPTTGLRLNMKCGRSRKVQRLQPPSFPNCLDSRVNASENRTAPTSSVKDNKDGSGELTYAYLAIGLFICVCSMIAFPYRHIYRLCSTDSPDSSNCSTPNLYEQVPMEVQPSQVQPYEETVTIEREPTPSGSEVGSAIELGSKSDVMPSPETLLTEPSVVEEEE